MKITNLTKLALIASLSISTLSALDFNGIHSGQKLEKSCEAFTEMSGLKARVMKNEGLFGDNKNCYVFDDNDGSRSSIITSSHNIVDELSLSSDLLELVGLPNTPDELIEVLVNKYDIPKTGIVGYDMLNEKILTFTSNDKKYEFEISYMLYFMDKTVSLTVRFLDKSKPVEKVKKVATSDLIELGKKIGLTPEEVKQLQEKVYFDELQKAREADLDQEIAEQEDAEMATKINANFLNQEK